MSDVEAQRRANGSQGHSTPRVVLIAGLCIASTYFVLMHLPVRDKSGSSSHMDTALKDALAKIETRLSAIADKQPSDKLASLPPSTNANTNGDKDVTTVAELLEAFRTDISGIVNRLNTLEQQQEALQDDEKQIQQAQQQTQQQQSQVVTQQQAQQANQPKPRQPTLIPFGGWLTSAVVGAPLDPKTGKLAIPERCKHIRVDIGTNYNLKITMAWLMYKPDRMVYGFEPNLNSRHQHVYGADDNKYAVAVRPYLWKRFYSFPSALHNYAEPTIATFYSTKEQDTSSLLPPNPNKHPTRIASPVSVVRLDDFLEYIPWDRFPYVEHIKIDAQGVDLHIIKAAGPNLERVVFVTLEKYVPPDSYSGQVQQAGELIDYMKTRGFTMFDDMAEEGASFTFLNDRLKHKVAEDVLDALLEKGYDKLAVGDPRRPNFDKIPTE